MSMAVVGLLLLISAALYYGYGIRARSQLDDLNTSAEGPVSLPAEAAMAGFTPVAASGTTDRSDTASGAGQSEATESDSLLAGYAAAFPGLYIHPKYWDQPLWAGTDPRPAVGLPDGYSPVSAGDGLFLAPAAAATRIRIPIIDVDSTVDDLAIIDLGDSRAYETPKNTVGHIPATVNPGQIGNGWFFGHLESPIKGEGSVFFRLPKIPEHLKNGDPVYISLVTDSGEYLYQVTATRVVHEDDLALYDSAQATITLVSCVPRLVYDHRLLVTAKLVGVKS
ncbi:MAG: sortase [Chloroflexi bacterium]|nr:sortase [Chloroflexota bacterium]